jgi:putative transposase
MKANVASGLEAAVRRARKRVPRGTQLELDAVARFPLVRRGRGGKRVGAGRKRAPGVRPSVPHRVRGEHRGENPVLVTLRARPGLPSLRRERVNGMLREVLCRQRQRRYAKIFQVVEFTIQDDHLHFIVEATGVVETGMQDAPDALRSGVSGLVISFAKQLNKLLGRRRGKVWGDRFHSRELGSPNEVRNALVYVFRNLARHGTRILGDATVDQLSSAPRFKRFTRPVLAIEDAALWPQAPPRTWLLNTGWWTRTRHGLLDPNEVRRMGK